MVKITSVFGVAYVGNVYRDNPVFGQNYFEEATTGTHHLTSKELINFRRKTIAQYHLRPQYLYQKLKETGFDFTKLKNYSKYGFRLINNLTK